MSSSEWATLIGAVAALLVAVATASNSAGKERVSALELALGSLQETVKTLQEENRHLHAEIAAKDDLIAKLRSDMGAAINAKDDRIRQLQCEVDELSARLEKLSKKPRNTSAKDVA